MLPQELLSKVLLVSCEFQDSSAGAISSHLAKCALVGRAWARSCATDVQTRVDINVEVGSINGKIRSNGRPTEGLITFRFNTPSLAAKARAVLTGNSECASLPWFSYDCEVRYADGSEVTPPSHLFLPLHFLSHISACCSSSCCP